MRVLHWYPDFKGGGGVANSVLGLALAQARLGATVSIAAAGSRHSPLYEPMAMDGTVALVEWNPWRTVPVPGGCIRLIPAGAARELRQIDPNVVHVHGELNPNNFWVPRLFRCPIILSPHGGFHPEVFRRSRRAAKSMYVRIAKHMLYRRVCAFHALSYAEREHIVRILPRTRVYCLPQGPNVRIRLSEVPDVRVQVDERIRFVFVGRVDIFTKGLDLLLEAFALAMHRLGARKIALTVAGPDWHGDAARLRRRAMDLGIGPLLALPGALSGQEVAALLQRSDIYVQLSRHDGFPLSVSEALLAGKPVILSRAVGTSSYPEIAALPHVRIVSPDAGEAAEAMMSAARSLEALRMSAVQYQDQVRDFFSWERVAALQLATYDELGRDTKGPRIASPMRPVLK